MACAVEDASHRRAAKNSSLFLKGRTWSHVFSPPWQRSFWSWPLPGEGRLQARPRFDGAARRAQGRDSRVQEPGKARSSPAPSAITGSTCPAQYDGKEPACVMVFQDGGGYVESQGRVPRADRLRQPDPQEGDAGDDRHLHQPRQRSAGKDAEQKAAQQPQLRVRHAVATSTSASWRRRSCRRSARSTTCARTPPAAASAASAPAASARSPRPGSGPTCSARC